MAQLKILFSLVGRKQEASMKEPTGQQLGKTSRENTYFRRTSEAFITLMQRAETFNVTFA